MILKDPFFMVINKPGFSTNPNKYKNRNKYIKLLIFYKPHDCVSVLTCYLKAFLAMHYFNFYGKLKHKVIKIQFSTSSLSKMAVSGI